MIKLVHNMFFITINITLKAVKINTFALFGRFLTLYGQQSSYKVRNSLINTIPHFNFQVTLY